MARSRGRLLLALWLGVELLACGDATGPALPAGELVYRSLIDGGFYLMRADGSARRQIWTADDWAMCPSWSPDGSSIAFHKNSTPQVFVLTVATGLVRQLTPGPDQNHCPMWSPNGQQIAFFRVSQTATDGYPLYVMQADGSNATRLGTGTFMADRGAWSPDGQWIAASRFSDNHIALVNTATGAVGSALTPPGGGRAPSWSPDGRRIAFARQINGDLGIWLMDRTGADLRQLTTSPYFDGYPVWTLDGRRIAFHRYRYTSSSPGAVTVHGSLHLVGLDGVEAPWTVGDSADGDLVMWRPHR